jgi:protease-4
MSSPNPRTSPRRGPIARVLIGAWTALDFSRRLAMNLLFLLLLVVVIAAIIASGRTRPLLERTTLVIAPEGRVVEQYSSDPVSRGLGRAVGQAPAEIRLRDLLRVLEAAGRDPQVERVLLRPDRMAFSGFASLREVSAAVAALRASGKQVIAFGENLDQSQYLVAAQADEVYLDPMGSLLLEGLASYRPYFREALVDRLGVDVHLFKVGEYKSAAEPFVLDAPSPESREADLHWMNDLWQRHLADIARARKLSPQALAAGIEGLPAAIEAAGGDIARLALEQKLVDGLKTSAEVEALLAERGVADADSASGVREIGYDDYLARQDGLVAGPDLRPQVAVVVAEGEIVGGEQAPGTVGGESTAALLRQARDDEHVRAVVLRVNSPGGEVYASEQIRREVVALRAAGKPVVASMGDVAASGGYWISMDADAIYADASTITGSIGIFGMFPTFPRTLEKIGVRTDGVATTRLAGAFDPTRELDPDVGRIIQSVIEKGYRDFTGKVAKARGRDVAAIDQVARGRVWSGHQAGGHGLVDAEGGLRDAIAHAAGLASMGEADTWGVRYVEKPLTPFEGFVAGFANTRAAQAMAGDSALVRAMVADALPGVDRQLRFIERSLAPGGSPVKAVAHCFCGI